MKLIIVFIMVFSSSIFAKKPECHLGNEEIEGVPSCKIQIYFRSYVSENNVVALEYSNVHYDKSFKVNVFDFQGRKIEYTNSYAPEKDVNVPVRSDKGLKLLGKVEGAVLLTSKEFEFKEVANPFSLSRLKNIPSRKNFAKEVLKCNDDKVKEMFELILPGWYYQFYDDLLIIYGGGGGYPKK